MRVSFFSLLPLVNNDTILQCCLQTGWLAELAGRHFDEDRRDFRYTYALT